MTITIDARSSSQPAARNPMGRGEAREQATKGPRGGGVEETALPCSRCKAVVYCGKECQLQHWKKAGSNKAECK